MAASGLLVTNISNPLNAHNLAIFICHLFIDGHFRYGHILNDPNVFDDRFISEIDSICVAKIPWLTTDITQSTSLPWPANEPTDHILQLIFLNSTQLANKIDEFKDYLAFYRVFIFYSSAGRIDTKKLVSVARKVNPILKSNPLILENQFEGERIRIHMPSESGNTSIDQFKRIQDQNLTAGYQLDSKAHIFDETFGRNEYAWPIIMKYSAETRKMDDITTAVSTLGSISFANYFSNSILNVSYINMTYTMLNNITAPFKSQAFTHKTQKYYDELDNQYEVVKEEKM